MVFYAGDPGGGGGADSLALVSSPAEIAPTPHAGAPDAARPFRAASRSYASLCPASLP